MAERDHPDTLLSDRIYALREDAAGNLWIGTDQGLHCLNADRTRMTRILFNETNPEATAANDIRAILQDRNGAIWIGTFGGSC